MKSRRNFILLAVLTAYVIISGCVSPTLALAAKIDKPNILVLMSDNHSSAHLGSYGDTFVKTPNIDRLARKGVRFTNAYNAAPSCAPARAGLLTGQHIWRLEQGANLLGTLPKKFVIYTDLLRDGGYFVGYQGKGWAPGNVKASGRELNPAGQKFESFEQFLDANTHNKPWTFWLSSKDSSRQGGRELGSCVASSMDLEKVFVPPYLPDSKEVRSDICDYYFTVQRFDSDVGKAIRILELKGQLDNTVIVTVGDNGWQMPRGLANLYDSGSKIPLIISWKDHIPENRVADDFVNLNDLAPTFLELAGQDIPEAMTARSLKPILFSSTSGRIQAERNFIVTARERHAMGRKGGVGYPARAIRTDDYLFIRNYEPDRWPAGDPPLFADIDAWAMNYYSPTKEYMMSHKDDPHVKPLYELAFMKRPAEELFDLKKDPFQMNNVASNKQYQQIKTRLSGKLEKYLKNSGDPRVLSGQVIWDTQKYHGSPVARPRQDAIEKFHLDEEYHYLDSAR